MPYPTKKKLSEKERRAISQFMQDEMRAERRKPKEDRRGQEQLYAIAMSKLKKGDL